MKDEVFITIKELAERWRVNPLQVYRNKDIDSDFPKAYKPFGKILFKLKDVEKYEKSRIVK